MWHCQRNAVENCGRRYSGTGCAYKPGFIFGSEPTLRQCHETSQIFMGTERIFAGGAIEGMSFFIGLFSKEKGTFGFLGALQPLKK